MYSIEFIISNNLLFYYLKATRPKQWVKNLIVYAAPIFSGQFDKNILLNSSITFVIFILISSSIYLLNDVIDYKFDKLHKKKKERPIASGKISRVNALILSLILLVNSIVISIFFNYWIAITIVLYFLIQISYCFFLKRIAIIEIFCVSSGFFLRGLAGVLVNPIELSQWFILCLFYTALFIIIQKRKTEFFNFSRDGIITREVLRGYSTKILDKFGLIASNSIIVFYSLWAAGPILNGAKNSAMIITLPLVLMGVLRYQYLADSEEIIRNNSALPKYISCERPEDVIFQDKFIKITFAIWFLISISIIYLT